jgi:hypothetical protein
LRRRPFLRIAGLTGLGAVAFGRGMAGPDDPPVLYVEGYAGRVSYQAGDEVGLHLSSSSSTCVVEVARVGVRREIVWSGEASKLGDHPIPEDASSHGCRWPVSLKVPVGASWRSGYYHVTLRARDGGGRYVRRGGRTVESSCYFVVRPREGEGSKVLLPFATHTYNAYNNWGGFSLYAYNGRGGNQGHRVSYERPPTSLFPNWEQAFVEWAEASGLDIAYATNGDLEEHPGILKGRRLLLSVGHDEYWSAPMRDAWEGFVERGGNAAFLSGNTCCWQVRSEDGGRALTCWKQNFQQDPVFAARGNTATLATLSSLWSHHLVGRPENTLTGVGFLWGGYHRSHGQLMDASGGYTVHQPSHWLFEGTRLQRGDTLGAKDTVVGYECDGCDLAWHDGTPSPTRRDGTPASFQVLATAPAQWHPDDCEWYERWEKGRKGHAVLGTYQRGGTVVTVGSTDWSHGLRGRDPAVEQVTRNLLRRLGA